MIPTHTAIATLVALVSLSPSIAASGQASRPAMAPPFLAGPVATRLAQAPREARTATVEIVARAPSAPPHTESYLLSLGPEHVPSRVVNEDDMGRTVLTLRRGRAEGSLVEVEIELSRTRNTGSARQRTELSVAGRIAVGQRVKLGQVQERSGSHLEILVTLR